MKLPLAGCAYLLAASVAQAGVIKTLGSAGCEAATVGSVDKEYRSYNGTCNNEENPTWGSSGVMVGEGVQLQRWDDTAYYRDTSTLPSARAISNAASMQPNSVSVPNSKGVSAMLMQWGQFLDHDLDLTRAGDEPWNIAVANDDPEFGSLYGDSGTMPGGMPFHRSVWVPGTTNPREQLNVSTAFIDASQIYGSDEATAMSLRDPTGGGRLNMLNGLLPKDSSEKFFSGDERVREQVGLTSMHTLFSREHNRIADELAQQYRDERATPGQPVDEADLDETVYQETRKLVGAMMQSITFNEFLPALLGSSAPGAYDPDSDIYDPDINPGIYTEFSTAAYRFGHSTLAPTLLRLDEDFLPLPGGPLPLEQAFFNAENLIDPASAIGGVGIEPFLRGLVTQQAQAVDTLIVDALRNMLFPTMGGFDLAALNMQRGRDHGLPTYNQMRGILGLDTYERGWDDPDLTFSDDIIGALTGVYGVDGFDDLDLWIGGLAEAHQGDSLLGELFTKIVAGQFDLLRKGDRFWFERAGMFEDEWMMFIERSTLSAIMARNGISGLQANVFFVPVPATFLLIAMGVLLMRGRAHPRLTG